MPGASVGSDFTASGPGEPELLQATLQGQNFFLIWENLETKMFENTFLILPLCDGSQSWLHN